MARKSGKDAADAGKSGMRDDIKKLATQLLIAHGYHGTTFGVIANEVGATRTSIFYYFGNKQGLIEEAVQDYVSNAIMVQEGIWLKKSTSLAEKLQAVVNYNYSRYKMFNRSKRSNRPWSLIGRLRLESDVLSEGTRTALGQFTSALHDAVEVAVENAWDKGELKVDAPKRDLIFLLTHIVDSASVFAQDAGNFERLEQFYTSFSTVVLSAYSNDQPQVSTLGTEDLMLCGRRSFSSRQRRRELCVKLGDDV